MPKRPLSSYLHFCSENGPTVSKMKRDLATYRKNWQKCGLKQPTTKAKTTKRTPSAYILFCADKSKDIQIEEQTRDDWNIFNLKYFFKSLLYIR